ncbi:Ig-like domain-containing protein [Neobacillus sp. CF12]|uniref:Ig-like domain-containing protein n=1 Tax=Neobacillus sp. CF12 TaxID=3055864 RepID=UPI00259FF3CA|nr:Ig-like domain-containing protein [Neobacillus sp. CF12]MDM5329807.1 Ig-like domain-containing protein [Neobacillus sp. CF12]
MRKILAVMLVLQLFLIPTAAFGQEGKVEAPQPGKSLNENISSATAEGPRKSLKPEADYTDPGSYPTVTDGGKVGDMLDSKGITQSIFFNSVTNSTIVDNMNFSTLYNSTAASGKDSYTHFEFFTNVGGSMVFTGWTYFDTTGYTNVNLNSHLSKFDFSDQQYLYVRVGLSQFVFDLYYTNTLLFKVENPFYNGGGSTTDDSYAVISNESTDDTTTQPTGSFNVKDMDYTFDKNLKPETYKVDVNIPYNVPKNKEKQIKKNSSDPLNRAFNVGDSNSFWVMDLRTNQPYQITARLAYSGTKANIWVHNNQITDADAARLAAEFDNRIHASVSTNFGNESDVDVDGKINILNFDIQDGFTGSGGYTAGYFYALDLFDEPNSNKSEIFYIDTYPTMGLGATKDVTAAYETIAHEFQHMVNFNQNIFVENTVEVMPSWLNEALSMAAEQIYTGQGLSSRIDYYNASESISNGHSLLYWDNEGDTLSNYSLSYLFGQYIKKQANQGDSIFKEIINDVNNDYRAVENAAKKYIHSGMTFGKLMTSYRMALLLKQDTGLYGFKGDPFFDAVEEKLYFGSSTNLRGGGAVVTTFNSADGFTIPTAKGPNVTYTTFKMDGSGMDITPPAAPKVNAVTDQSTAVTGTAEANAQVIVKAGAVSIGTGTANATGSFSVTIPKQKGGTTLTVTAKDQAGNESSGTNVVVTATTTAYSAIKVQLNGKAFTGGYFGNGAAYVHWKALETLKIPFTFKGNGVFTIEGRTVTAQTINGGLFLKWTDLSPGKVTYKSITGGFNFIYAVPTKVQLNGKDFTGGYYKDGNTYVHWKVLDTFKIPYTFKGNGVFTIEGRTVQAQTINGGLFIAWNQLSPGKVTFKTITDGYNFIYAVPIKVQLNGQNFTGGYFKDGNAYVHWTALKTFKIPYTFKGGVLFDIGGRAVSGETINGAIYIRWNLLAPGKITFKAITDGYNFIYTP